MHTAQTTHAETTKHTEQPSTTQQPAPKATNNEIHRRTRTHETPSYMTWFYAMQASVILGLVSVIAISGYCLFKFVLRELVGSHSAEKYNQFDIENEDRQRQV